VRTLERVWEKARWELKGRRTETRYRAEHSIESVPAGARLHLGCGTRRLDGWMNLDYVIGQSPDIVHDLSEGLPLPDGHVSLIHSEHLFEHFALADGCHLMAECRRVLRPGGVMRIAMPDLADVVQAYLTGQNDPWIADYPELDTRAHALNYALRGWGHVYLYDAEDLQLRLTRAGFDPVETRQWGESPIAELRGLETRVESRLIMEATAPLG
jgi:predicted SAM-dependent methyltransferase